MAFDNTINTYNAYAATATVQSMTNAEFVADAYAKLLGLTGDFSNSTARKDYWVAKLEDGSLTKETFADAFLTAASTVQGDFITEAEFQYNQDVVAAITAADATNNDITDIETVVAGSGAEVPDAANPGSDIELTDGRDNLDGTDGDDTFVAAAGQNQNGAIANAFSTGDEIDGGAGRDKLVASIMPDYNLSPLVEQVIRAKTKNVEEMHFEVTENAGVFGGSSTPVTVQATRMENVEEFWSNFSDSDLKITDINLNGGNLNITKDVTFGMRDTKADAGLTATFDSNSITKEGAKKENSALSVQIADVSTETPATPLANVNMDLGFSLGGVDYVLEDIQADGGTYPGLITAIQTALAAEGLGDLAVTPGASYTNVTFAGNTVNLPFTATEVVITDPAGAAFTDVTFTQNAIAPVAGGFLVAGTAAPADPTETSTMIETNLILDNAGRGSMGGDVEIGGQSTSPIGVEKFNVTVDRDSKIASLKQSVNNNTALSHIDIDSMGANGNLTIGKIDDDLSSVTAGDFKGDTLTIGTGTAVNDLQSFNSAGSNTNVTLNAAYDGTGRASDAVAFTINTGAGNDTIDATLTGLSASGSTAASLTITSSGGNNTIDLTGSAAANSNVATVTTGSGTDTVTGAGTHLTASTGAGNDVIYAENTGTGTTAQIAAGVATTAYGTTTATTNSTVINGVNFLNGRDVVVTLGLPGTNPASPFVDGLEVIANVKASNGLLTTERDVYNAVEKAINEDAVLNKLATASVDSNGTLTVKYIVDGVTTAGPADAIIDFKVLSNAATDLNGAEAANLLAAVKEAYGDSQITATDITAAYDSITNASQTVDVTIAGTASTTTGVNTVKGGAGDDVIVLSSETGSLIDTVQFDAGNFGNDTIVHFTDGAGGDVLDFTAWLNNQENLTGSTSVDSRTDIAITLDTSNTASVIVANQVTVIDFSVLGTGGGVTFDNMTNADVLGALTAAGGFTVGAANAGIVGSTQNSLLMVQDKGGVTANEGEYKVYQVVSNNAAGEGFTSATLVGSIDFSNEQTFHVDNF